MKLISILWIFLLAFVMAFWSCSNYGLDQDKQKKDEDKKKCQTAVAAYLSCTSSNPAMGACDSLYLGVLGVCGGGGYGGGGSGGGGGY
ncbi:hypothetical protein LFX25_06010 [Leptospira sp. FAT2]|uniref:hypothetical protein n=1 Tax=Leptospira sanjuanensis TaxID=2879643 RepID=UPI001EE7FB6E|nr:hypothetical protein [Leptospira sanjuanensis]MCG6192793.1 hypothetical protein [Leptospira sanjuanensis]